MKMTKTAIELLLLLALLVVGVVAVVGAVEGNRNDIDAAAAVKTDSYAESFKFAANVDNFTINNKVRDNKNNKNNNKDKNTHDKPDDNGIVNDNVNYNEFNQVINKSAGIGVNATAVVTIAATNAVPFDRGNNAQLSTSQQPRILKRGKRYLDFVKGTRVSWRTTVKNNILKVNTLWGHGWGFRSNFPFADKKDRLRPFFKRDLLHATIDMLDGHGLDGRACILKSYCTALLDGDTHIGGGMIFKLLKFIFSSGFDGEACILKAFCTAHYNDDEQEDKDFEGHGLLFKFLKHIFTLNSHDKRHFPYLHLDNCHQLLHSHCPLSFNSISPYTDDV